MSQFLKRMWGIWFFLVFSGIFLAMLPIFLVFLSKSEWYPKASQMRRVWGRLLMPLIGIPVHVRYEAQPDPTGTYLYFANHTSYLDIPAFSLLSRGYLHFMGKAELKKIPLFNIFFHTIDIAVNRRDKDASNEAFAAAAKNLREGRSIVIFPEGTTSEKGYSMLRFKDSPFKLAIESQLPILPVTFLDHWRLFPDNGSFLGKPGNSRVVVHRPIETKGLTLLEVDKLKDTVYKVINNTLIQHHES